jgi:DNA-directed RNA polymerase specialized sigma24 family protein
MPGSIITLAELETICCQAAATWPISPADYRPTVRQIYFFTLVWLLKRKVIFQQADDCLDNQTAASSERAYQVAQHLDEWGGTVARLKQREAKEWELLRIQMEKALRYYYSQPEGMQADALQEALLKIFELLNKMIDGRQLDETDDIVTLVVNSRASLTNIYDFGSPFYAFAKRIARNELVTRLRKENRQPIYSDPLEEMNSTLPAVPPPSLPEDEDALMETRLFQLKIDLARLLELIQHGLTPKPRRVVCQTLAAQPQFWQALNLTGLTLPENFPSPAGFSTDGEIAAVLGLTENSVRVHRVHAKKQIRETDPVLEILLDKLLTRRGKNGKAESS